MTLTGREYLPSKKSSRPLIPELIRLEDNLERLGITREQLVDVALLVGTDFNEGVMGIGPRKGLALIKKYVTADNLPGEFRNELPKDLDELRNTFLHPRVLDDYSLRKNPPDPDGIVQFLSGERGFARDRVQKVAGRLAKSMEAADSQLGEWFA